VIVRIVRIHLTQKETTMTRTALVRRSAGAAVALTVALAFVPGAGGASAAPPTAPTLVPPPLDWYSCQTTGSGTVCHGTQDFSHTGGFDGTCPQGFDILDNGAEHETGHRYYDRQGFLVKRVLHDVYPVGDPRNVFYNSVTGKTVAYRADVIESDSFGVPGDFASVTATVTGELYSATLPGSGLLVHDVGTFMFAPDGEVLVDHGPKMLFSGDNAALCAALAGGS
jgi:hypothetical protein